MTDRELIDRLMQGEFNLYPMEYAPTLKMGDLSEGNYIQVSRNGIEMLAEDLADPKTAFLEELQSLLRRHNACMWVQGETNATLIISLNGDESVIPNMCGVNADNIDIIKKWI